MELMAEYVARGFLVMLSISMPCVLTAAAIGLVVGVLQAVTQVQEQTIAAAPKILCVFLVIIIFGMAFLQMLVNFMLEGSNIAFDILPKNDVYVLSKEYYRYTKPFRDKVNPKAMKPVESAKDVMTYPGKPPIDSVNSKEKFYPASRSADPKPSLIETKQIFENGR